MASGVTVSAQGVVKGKVLDKGSGSPVEFASLRVLNQSDSSFVTGVVTDVDGLFSLKDLKSGNYIFQVSYVGYKDFTHNVSVPSPTRTISVPTFFLSQNTQMLKGVTVTALQSSMKLEVDRKSYDVSQMITNSGDAASDVLDNIPSIEVDDDGNVSLRGNSSVEVWINGKSSGMTSDNVAEILQQLPAESIDRIEVIDNPSAKYSAEGSAGIINIVLKKDLKPGYYGAAQVGGNTLGQANASFGINYNSPKWDARFNIGYRHRARKGRSESEQDYLNTHQYQNSTGSSNQSGNNLFLRAGATYHATEKDEISIGGMFMKGARNNWSNTLYDYGYTSPAYDSHNMLRRTKSSNDMVMFYGELGYKHMFSDRQNIEFTLDYNNFSMDNDNIYQDSTTFIEPAGETTYDYQYRPMSMRNQAWEVKADYENTLTDKFKIQAGYQGNFSRQNTPQDYFIDDTNWDGANQVEAPSYYNRFIYGQDVHAGYFTAAYNFGKLSLMGGLRGEYWKVNTSTYDYDQEHDPTLRDEPYEKGNFKLFPSFFITYNLTPSDEFQLNYTRRLRRPWGGQLNSFRNTSDASMISYGNPELTPEYSNSFTFNYLKTWEQHSLMLSAYYRPTSDVMQRIQYQSSGDGMMYSTTENVASSTSSGFEAVVKNHLFSILDLTTTLDAYDRRLSDFSYDIDGQTVTGDASHTFTWTASMIASVMLPYGMTFQATGRYYSKRAITQGYNKPNYSVNIGLRKNFLNKKLILAINCRDLFNSRKRQAYTSSDTFTRFQMNKRGDRSVRATLTWNFGKMGEQKERPGQQGEQDMGGDDEGDMGGGFGI